MRYEYFIIFVLATLIQSCKPNSSNKSNFYETSYIRKDNKFVFFMGVEDAEPIQTPLLIQEAIINQIDSIENEYVKIDKGIIYKSEIPTKEHLNFFISIMKYHPATTIYVYTYNDKENKIIGKPIELYGGDMTYNSDGFIEGPLEYQFDINYRLSNIVFRTKYHSGNVAKMSAAHYFKFTNKNGLVKRVIIEESCKGIGIQWVRRFQNDTLDVYVETKRPLKLVGTVIFEPNSSIIKEKIVYDPLYKDGLITCTMMDEDKFLENE